MQSYDTIIVGGGHNGLVCAAYLARAGQKVLLLEASESLGGLASTREFHPGFKVSVAHTISQFSPRIAADLKLAEHGYSGAGESLATVGLSLTGDHVRLRGDTVEGVSSADADNYGDYLSRLRRFARMLEPFWMKTMPRIGNNSLRELLTFAQVGLRLRLLGRKDMGEFMRIAALPARDLMDENFDSELLKATLSWDALIGSRQAPRSPNNTVLTMLYKMTGEQGGIHALPAGGMASLVGALAGAASAAGAEIRAGSPVSRILLQGDDDGLRATGVELPDGRQFTAARIVSAADPKRTFLDMVGARNLEIGFANRINRLRCDGFVAKLHLALSGLPRFSGLDSADGRMIIAPTMDSLEFAYDDAKYGRCPERPVMEVLVPSLRDASLAPGGQHVLSAHVMYIPNKLVGGWSESARDALADRLLDTLCLYSPGLRNHVLYAELLTPADLEQGWHVTGGHWHHTELAMDQMLMMRPTYEAAQYSTPIPGLYLCGAGSHPGGGLMGGAGHNAAYEILK